MGYESEKVAQAVFSITAKKGTHALLLGSGVSRSAHIPTGWDIVMDLARKLSLFLEGKEMSDVEFWYRNQFNKEPDYSDILSILGKTPAERSSLLCSYFEPNSEESSKNWKKPTSTHKSIAMLMAAGIIKIVLTTNFDRLLEKALSDINVQPIVIKHANDLEGISSLIHIDKPLLIKVNGDYLDSRIKNTPEELKSYDKSMENLISRIFAEYGLVIAGWSGKYDTGLIECYKNNPNKVLSTYWIDPYPLSEQAINLLSMRDGVYLNSNSDSFFSDLARKISAIDLGKNVPNNLPNTMSSFIGRDKEIKQITDLLSKKRVVTLVGPGGTGKTRLSIETARTLFYDFPDGIFFADLTNIQDGDHLSKVICTAIGISEDGTSQPEKSLMCHLKDKKILLVLDNCEQIIDFVSDLVSKIYTACEKVSILATSREALLIETECILKILPLTTPDPKTNLSIEELIKFESIQLFCERAKTSNPLFNLDEFNKDHVSKICNNLDGMPLAIELASARTRVLTPKQICEKLSDRFRILTSTMRNIPSRQQTLQATIDWSYDLLGEKEKALFGRLSMFSGGLTLEMAEQVCPDDSNIVNELCPEREIIIERWEIIDLLQSLCDKSLVRTATLQDDSQRFSMYETIKEYAKIKFEETHDSELFKKSFIAHFYKIIEEMSNSSNSKKEKMEFFGKEFDNIEVSIFTSMKVGLHKQGFSILVHFCDYLRKNELHLSAINLLEFSLKHEDKSDDSDLSLIYYNLGWMQFSRNSFSEAKTSLLRSLEYAKKSENQKMLLRSYHGLVFLYSGIGEYHKALEYNNYYHETAKRIGDDVAILASILNFADILMSIGKYEGIDSYFDEYAKLLTTSNSGDIGLYNYLRGYYCFLKGRYCESEDFFLRALEFSKENNDLYLEFDCLYGISILRIHHCEYEKALNVISRIEHISALLDDKNLLCGKYIIQGNVSLCKYKFMEAVNIFGFILNDLREHANASHLHQAILGIGQAQNRSGLSDKSKETLETLLDNTHNFRIRFMASIELASAMIVKDTQKAMQLIENCAKENEILSNPKDRLDILKTKALCFLKQGNALKAIKILEETALNEADYEYGKLQCESLLSFALAINGNNEETNSMASNLICRLERLSMLGELQIVYYSLLLANSGNLENKHNKAKAQELNQKMGIENSFFENAFRDLLFK